MCRVRARACRFADRLCLSRSCVPLVCLSSSRLHVEISRSSAVEFVPASALRVLSFSFACFPCARLATSYLMRPPRLYFSPSHTQTHTHTHNVSLALSLSLSLNRSSLSLSHTHTHTQTHTHTHLYTHHIIFGRTEKSSTRCEKKRDQKNSSNSLY